MLNATPFNVAIVGAGMAGATCARALSLAGHSVHVFEKSRGPGGRMASRRLEWHDHQSQACTSKLDFGALCITARSAPFRAFVDHALHTGRLLEWVPTLAAGSLPLRVGEKLCVPTPDMPALCRELLEGATVICPFAVERLHRGPQGWQLEAGGERYPAHFDAVVLAVPLPQAAALLGAHRSDWAHRASAAVMRPCWTLMAVTDAPGPGPDWDLARPVAGPLASVLRHDARPGRPKVPAQAHWVAHARTGWSRRHLDHPAASVQQQMQAALAGVLGGPVVWQHCVVHRWRYASPQARSSAPVESHWWDAGQCLGVCADAFGGSGVEAAWLSAQALCAAMLSRASDTLEVPATPGREPPLDAFQSRVA